jgi:threonyl-tRNA synthetase
MAEAIENTFPGAQLVYGPPTDQGFYYDIRFSENHPISSEDFPAIEKRMAEIIAEDRPFRRYQLDCDEGIEKLRKEGSKYKIDNAERAMEAGSDQLSWYVTGEVGSDWEDLCKGSHLPSTGRIGAFKLLSVAGSHWKGDASNGRRLQRLYGTAWFSKKDQAAYLERLEEAKRRDHRVLGKQLGLFSITSTKSVDVGVDRNSAAFRDADRMYCRGNRSLIRSPEAPRVVVRPEGGENQLTRLIGRGNPRSMV